MSSSVHTLEICVFNACCILIPLGTQVWVETHRHIKILIRETSGTKAYLRATSVRDRNYPHASLLPFMFICIDMYRINTLLL